MVYPYLFTRGSIIAKFMSIGAVITLVVIFFALGALLAARAGIRSIQSARAIVFYRTRRARMMAGWQWLIVSLVLFSFTIVSAMFGQPVANRLFSPPPISPITSTWTPSAAATQPPLPTRTTIPIPTQTPGPAATPLETSPALQTPTEPATVLQTLTSTQTAPPSQTSSPLLNHSPDDTARRRSPASIRRS